MVMDDAGERTYVLIHGAWHGGWVRKDAARRHRAIGHEVYAPSLTGLGDRRHLLRPDITLNTHAEELRRQGRLRSAGALPDRIASAVYLDALVPEPGRSLVRYARGSAEPDETL